MTIVKGTNYFWIGYPFDTLKEVLLTATSMEGAAVEMRNRGIVCNKSTISTIASKYKLPRPNINKRGAGRKPNV
jgi:hypothetical protein